LYYIINIYSPCNLTGKRKLWAYLLGLKMNFDPGEWFLGGDFISITRVGERRGRAGDGGQAERT
jgi:hypothetical protein